MDRERFAADKPFPDALCDHGLEQLAQKIALAETAMPVLGKGRVVGHCAVEPEPAEPPVSQVQVHLLAQPPFRADAKAVADDQHADHELRIDRGTASVAIERCEVMPQLAEIEEAINGSQQVSARHILLEVEGVEELVLPAALPTHHRRAPSL